MDDSSPERMPEAFGAYVRSQRQLARLTLRQAAELARISNPYLSQIEHGLASPSVRVITALADALQVSANNLLLRAAGTAAGETDMRSVTTENAIRQDPRLDEAQKQALLAVLRAFFGPAAAAARGRGPRRTSAPRRRQPPKDPPQDGKAHNDV